MARRELGPAALAVVQAVAAALTDADAHLLVACSGGPDSLALAFGAHRAATREGRALTAVVVDHNLQPDSAAVAERAGDQLGRLGFTDVVIAEVTVPADAEGGPEAVARTAALAREDADLLDALAAEADPGTDTLHAATLLDQPAALRTRVIRRWLLRHGADEATARHVAAVEELVTRWHGQGEINLPGVRVTRQDGSLHCQPDG